MADPNLTPDSFMQNQGAALTPDSFMAKRGFSPKNPDPAYKPPDPTISNEAAADIGRFGLNMLPALGATAAVAAGPPGWLAGTTAAILGGAGGSLLKQGAQKAFGSPEAPQSFGDVAKTTGEDAAVQGASEVGGRILTGAISKVFGRYFNPEQLYGSGLKPAGPPSQALKNVQTGIREEIPLNANAAPTARQRINQGNAQVSNIISQNPQDIPAQQYVANIKNRFDGLRDQWSKDATAGSAAVKQIDEMERQFLIQHGNPQPLSIAGKTVTPDEMSLKQLRQQARPLASADAQAIKTQTYKGIRRANQGAWEAGSNPGVTVDTSQEITGALKQELEQLYPQIKGINARDGALIDLEKALKGYSKREMNKQVTPYFIFPAAGAALGHAAGALSGVSGEEGAAIGAVAGHFLRNALEDPGVKSRLAIVLSKTAKTGVGKAAKTVAPYLAPAMVRIGEAAGRTVMNPPQPQQVMPPPGQQQ